LLKEVNVLELHISCIGYIPLPPLGLPDQQPNLGNPPFYYFCNCRWAGGIYWTAESFWKVLKLSKSPGTLRIVGQAAQQRLQESRLFIPEFI
jgi:hypothetical protein